MKIVCTQENLSKGLNIVSNLTSKNLNLPILNNVLLQADKEGLVLITTNLEIGIKTRVRGKVEQPGSFTVQAKLMSDFVNSLKKENINIELNDNTLVLEGENHKTKIKGENATDFPLIPEINPDLQTTVKTTDFKEALSQVIFAASQDESRPELNAVFVSLEGSKMILVATDSYRLSEKHLALTEEIKENRAVIIPIKTLQQLARILNEQEAENTKIIINENQVKFEVGDTELISRIIDGQYPDYQQIIPDKFATEVSFSVSEFIQNIKSTSLFCQAGINDIRLSYVPDTKEVQLRAQNSSAGDNLSKLAAEVKGKAGEIVFNYRYLLEVLNNLKSSDGILKLIDSNSPGLLTGVKDEGFLYLIMPIKQ